MLRHTLRQWRWLLKGILEIEVEKKKARGRPRLRYFPQTMKYRDVKLLEKWMSWLASDRVEVGLVALNQS